MMILNTPLDYACSACDTMMRQYAAPDLPPKGAFHYHAGVFLSGMHETWKLCGDDRYFLYIKDWIDSVFDVKGNIKLCTHADLDDIQPGILLFPILEKTKDPHYIQCLQSVYQEVLDVPRNSEGGFWHKTSMKDQMWLDGLYMAGPFCAQYAQIFNLPDLKADVIHQACLMEQKTLDDKTGLLYHAWDGAKEESWADSDTGRSSEFWGRAMGWVPIALLNDLDYLEENVPDRQELVRISTNLLKALCKYQSNEGRWYQVVDKGYRPDNWFENSCSCLYVAGLCKAMRKGYLPKEYEINALRCYHAVIQSLEWKGDKIQIGHVCIGTGVGDYQHYVNRPVHVNDLHAVGTFLLMCTEMQKWLNIDKQNESEEKNNAFD